MNVLNPSLALLTDFYQLSMAYGYWRAKIDQREAVFHLFFRQKPFKGGFTIAAGLEAVIDFIQNFHFTSQDIEYLKDIDQETKNFSADFFTYLKNLKLTCDVDALPEGTVTFPYEPLIRIKGPLAHCQLLESPLLNLINFPTLIATKAARICIAAGDDPVFEFGLRRAQGIDGALTASRASYIGGSVATSNVLAGKYYNIPVKGTHSHSWVMAFSNELEAFKTYAKYLPNNCVFLVDTYHSLEGVKKAISVGLELKAKGIELTGIRLDSGDLAYLSIQARALLDKQGFQATKIYASNELDERVIQELKMQGAKIDIWGVGTNLTTAKGQGALDGVYKLAALKDEKGQWQYTLKLSEQFHKMSNPGILQVRRYQNEYSYIGDAIYNEEMPITNNCFIVDPLDPTRFKQFKGNLTYEDLLVPIFKKGKLVYKSPSLENIRAKTKQALSLFPIGIKRFLNPHQYVVGMEQQIYQKKIALIKDLRKG